MALTYTTLTADVYKADVFNLLKNVEGAKIDTYLDTKNIPTIGIGFNIKDNANLRNEIFKIFGLGIVGSVFRVGLSPAERIIEDSYINKITNLINHAYPDNSKATVDKLKADLNAIMDERYNQLSPANQALTQNFFGFEDNSDTGDMRTVFDYILPTYEQKVTDWSKGSASHLISNNHATSPTH